MSEVTNRVVTAGPEWIAENSCPVPINASLIYLPNQFQSKLNLSGGCGSTGDCSGRAGGLCACGGRRKRDQIWSIKIRPVQQIENLRAKLQSQPLAQCGRLECGEVPGSQSWTD